MRAVVSVAAVAGMVVVASAARADDFRFTGFHVAYDIGASVGQLNGVRQALDAGAVFGWMKETGSSGNLWDHSEGILVGVSGMTGFHVYPTYVAGEVGYGADSGLAGIGAVIGPAARLDPTGGAGGALRVGADLILVQTGLHLVVIAGPNPEAQFMWTIGIGRY